MGLLAATHPWGWLGSPVKRPSYATQGWASPREARSDIHRGMDIRAAVGDPTYAVAGGTVIAAEHGSPSAGNWIAIRHFGGLVTRYLHLSRIDVRHGQTVFKGQLIGLTGNTGNSAGPHLHYDTFVPANKTATYDLLFGRPPGGYAASSLGYGVKVPVEPMIPIDAYSPSIQAYSRESGVALHGGAGAILTAGVLVVGGVLVYKNWPRIRRRLKA